MMLKLEPWCGANFSTDVTVRSGVTLKLKTGDIGVAQYPITLSGGDTLTLTGFCIFNHI
ncbi:MAG: hypothetical protein IPF52_16300 [Saprospiraceae bacterium]|nr:hypothetical protein [Saprospiraceae bacterium]